MRISSFLAVLAISAHSVAAAVATSPEEAVRATEIAFARTMADRDAARFASFLDPDAVFLSRDEILRGAAQVAEGWRAYFEGPQAPFSWEPERVAIIASGDLATSTGPVRDPAGKQVGTFVSTWRKNAEGKWRIVLDTGCRCPASGP